MVRHSVRRCRTLPVGSDHPLTIARDLDRLGWTRLRRLDDDFFGLGAGVDDRGNALLVEREHTGRVEGAVARSHALVAIDGDLDRHESVAFATPATISPYASTKAAGELLCHTYAHLFNIRCVCLRFFTVYGARQRPDLAIHKFARLITDGKPIQVFGDGTTRRDYTYIDDIIAGVRAAIDYDGSMYEIFNLGESETTELSRLIELLEQNLDLKAEIDRQPLQPGDVPITYADVSKARKLLGYDPRTKIEEGIPKFVEWFRSATSEVGN